MLNKPRHANEIYNDSSAGLVALIDCLSNKENGIILIKYLYTTKYNEQTFNWALDFRNAFEDCYYDETVRRLRKYIKHLNDKYNKNWFSVIIEKINAVENVTDEHFKQAINEADLSRREIELLYRYIQNYQFIMKLFLPAYNEAYKKYYDELANRAVDNINIEISGIIKIDDKSKKYIKKLKLAVEKILRPDNVKQYQYIINELSKEAKRRAINEASNVVVNRHDGDVDIVKLAAATFIVYVQSRDGAGVAWSDALFGNTTGYNRYVDRLYDVMKRLQGVNATQVDAMAYLRDNGYENNFINNPRVMMYLDPSYLQQPGKGKTNHKTEITDRYKILTLIKEKKSKNVGSVYKQSWETDDHEEFLNLIKDAKCKILLSNYDDENKIYKRILVDENEDKTRWKRLEFETKTSVSNGLSLNRERTEVLWYNY